MKTHWENNSIQFPRLISELQAIGVFNNDILEILCEEMDLNKDEILEIVDRAGKEWDEIKSKLSKSYSPFEDSQEYHESFS